LASPLKGKFARPLRQTPEEKQSNVDEKSWGGRTEKERNITKYSGYMKEGERVLATRTRRTDY